MNVLFSLFLRGVVLCRKSRYLVQVCMGKEHLVF